MKNKLFLVSLTLIGFRKNYTVCFKEGLNFISGPLSTGKSSIVELIDYALGKEKHKSYIEIKKSCSDVELVLFIGNKKYKIVRPLFDFKRPVKIFDWNEELDSFSEEFQLAEIDIPSNEKSLSAFLLREVGLPNIKIANQSFSFRDLFKYSYISQARIDSENLLNEKMWQYNFKRKHTFEIIFGIYNELLGDLKQQLKIKNAEINSLQNKRDGIYEFLKNLDLIDTEIFQENKEHINLLLQRKRNKLSKLKKEGKHSSKGTLLIENRIFKLKSNIEHLKDEIDKKNQYIEKLTLLRNQYIGDIEKINFIIEGAKSFRAFKFDTCPSCLNQLQVIKSTSETANCNLCGSKLKDLTIEEIDTFKNEIRRITLKSNSLIKFIDIQKEQLSDLNLEKNRLYKLLIKRQNELDHIQSDYVSPYLEQIERLNYEIGALIESEEQLNEKLKVINQFAKINNEIINEETMKTNLEEQINSIETDTLTKEEVVKDLSQLFDEILTEFSFPKLSDAYIKESDYLPYVRGVKYDELGSGGAVTMTTMAYFLSIALLKIKNKNHLGLLIMDSPRKNLGADAKLDDDFKDEAIFNSIIKYFMFIFDDENKHKDDLEEIQLIIVSNGTPEYLNKNDLIVEFDGEGNKGLPYGLIDDIENL